MIFGKKTKAKDNKENLYLLTRFLGYATLDANRYEPKVAQGICVSTEDILKYVCHINFTRLPVMSSCHEFYMIKMNKAYDAKKHTHTFRGRARYQYSESVKQFTPLDTCAYLTDLKAFNKFILKTKGINPLYIHDAQQMLQKVANQMTKDDCQQIHKLLKDHQRLLIQEIKESAQLVREASDHVIKYKWTLFKKEFKSLIHFHDYRFTKHEQAMNEVCDELWSGTF